LTSTGHHCVHRTAASRYDQNSSHSVPVVTIRHACHSFCRIAHRAQSRDFFVPSLSTSGLVPITIHYPVSISGLLSITIQQRPRCPSLSSIHQRPLVHHPPDYTTHSRLHNRNSAVEQHKRRKPTNTRESCTRAAIARTHVTLHLTRSDHAPGGAQPPYRRRTAGVWDSRSHSGPSLCGGV